MKSPERKAKEAANARAWRAANRERARAVDRAYRVRNADAVKATKKRSYEKHREQNLAYAAAYREANLEQIKANAAGKYSQWSAKYREKNPEKCRSHGLAWKANNKERHRAYCAEWTRKNPLKNCLKEHRRRARKIAAGGTLSENIVERLMKLQRGRCACCGEQLNGKYHIDHITPLVRGGTNSDENIQLLLPRCNLSKGPKDPIEYMQARGRLL